MQFGYLLPHVRHLLVSTKNPIKQEVQADGLHVVQLENFVEQTWHVPFSTKKPDSHVEHSCGVHVRQLMSFELQALQFPAWTKYPLAQDEQLLKSQTKHWENLE